MRRKDHDVRSITPAIIPVRLSSEPLSPEKQERLRQELQEIKQRRQHYLDEIRMQAVLTTRSDNVNRIT